MSSPNIEVFPDVEQGSEEWLKLRLGLVTASNFSTVLANGRGGGESKTRRKYLLQLAAETLTGDPSETYSNDHMLRGQEMEAKARELYAFRSDAEIERIGFIKRGRAGCSPDGLIGKKKMLEIKTTLPHLLIDIHLRGEYPPGHEAQCQGNLWIAQREEIDIAIYWPKMPLYVQTIRRNEKYIEALERAVDEFNHELAYVVHQMRKLA